MSYEGKYININEIGQSLTGKTKIFMVVTNNDGIELGHIKWHAPWRQYIFRPETNTIFEKTCLADITHFLEAQMKERRK